MNLTAIQTPVAIALAVLSIVVIVFGAGSLHRVGAWLTRVGANVLAFMTAGGHITRQQETLDAILAELKPNGGSSMRDAIDKTQRDVERALRIAQGVDARTLFMLDNDPIPAFEDSAEGDARWVNRAMLAMAGRPLEEMLGAGWTNAIYPADRDRVRKAWNAAVREGRVFEETYRFVTPDGHITECDVLARPSVRDGEVVGWVGRAVPRARVV